MCPTNVIQHPINLVPLLERCGYASEDVCLDYAFADGQSAAVVAFAHAPHDARSSCIAVGVADADPEAYVSSLTLLGAPVALVLTGSELQWWMPGPAHSRKLRSCPLTDASHFVEEHHKDLAPDTLYRAKNYAGRESPYQQDFVDLGLLPFVEHNIGEKLADLVESLISEGLRELEGKGPRASEAQGIHWLFRAVFHLLAGKILRDKHVPAFVDLDLMNAEAILKSVGLHYGHGSTVRGEKGVRAQIMNAMAKRVATLSTLQNLTTETLGYVYESTLVSKETRKELGTHSTPAYLVDYIVWSLADWIGQIPVDRRHVYEPTCGHAGFLISAMRLLRDLHPGTSSTSQADHDYLRERLHGLERDPFALEIARLGLTLADVPNPDGWKLRCDDIFKTMWPEPTEPAPDILFMNPPFEAFSAEDRENYSKAGLTYEHKAMEVFARCLAQLQPGGVFGVVMPESVLHGKNSTSLRQKLCAEFELREVTMLPDKVFAFSDAESAILLGRRIAPRNVSVRIGRVDGSGIDHFRKHQALSDLQVCSQDRLAEHPGCDLRIPRMDDIWGELEHLPRLGTWVDGGKGFEHIGQSKLPPGAVTVSDREFPGAVRGFTTFDTGVMLEQLPTERWVSLDPALIGASRHGTVTGQPQILLNYARVSRGPWRLKALVDPDGHAVNSNFVVLRPGVAGLLLEFLWALLNSPLANAYTYCHLGKRHNLVGEILKMPVPRCSQADMAHLASVVRTYLQAVQKPVGSLTAAASPEKLRDLMLRVDAAVLRLYELPPRMERRLLDLFQRNRRQGVSFEQTEYFPEDFRPCIPLYEYLSEEYRQTTAGELRKRYRPVEDPVVLEALRVAADAFTLEEGK